MLIKWFLVFLFSLFACFSTSKGATAGAQKIRMRLRSRGLPTPEQDKPAPALIQTCVRAVVLCAFSISAISVRPAAPQGGDLALLYLITSDNLDVVTELHVALAVVIFRSERSGGPSL